MTNDRRLGRGLGALLSDSEPQVGPTEVDITSIRPNPFQPRSHFDTAALEELRDSIQRHGVLQPIVVRRRGSQYEIVAGERRWRASRLAGLQRIPAVVREDLDDLGMLELALIENVQRQDLDPIERAHAFQRLQHVLNATQEQVADRVGLKRPTVANLLRLLELPEPVQGLVSGGQLSMGHARAILGAKDGSMQVELAKEAVVHGWNVREIESRVRSLARPPSPKSTAHVSAETIADEKPAWVAALEDRLTASLGTRVAIRVRSAERGQISIDFYDRRDLDRLLALLAPRELI